MEMEIIHKRNIWVHRTENTKQLRLMSYLFLLPMMLAEASNHLLSGPKWPFPRVVDGRLVCFMAADNFQTA